MTFDCIIFLNELDLLELRFRELDTVVDRFVIVESPTTFAGHPKPLIFDQNKQRFSAWRERISHVIVDNMPQGTDPWRREVHQRNAVLRGLEAVALQDPGDIILLSDADEIPSADAIRRWSPAAGPHRFEQLCSYYWLNCVGGGWAGSRILTRGQLSTFANPDAVRYATLPLLQNGGWHFSFMGGPQQIVQKLESYSHQDLNQARYKDPRYLAVIMGLGIDIFNRSDRRWSFWPIDDRFPQALRDYRETFAHLCCDVRFQQDWYPDDQLLRLMSTYESINALDGAIVDIGCWEGKSTIALANACSPQQLFAVDTWAGHRSESPTHITVELARRSDILAQFQRNIERLTPGNVITRQCDPIDFLQTLNAPLKFVHIDSSHDYETVRHTIEACLNTLAPGGILCGDDFLSANITRTDLDGGVERAVTELLPGFQHVHNFWYWRNQNPT